MENLALVYLPCQIFFLFFSPELWHLMLPLTIEQKQIKMYHCIFVIGAVSPRHKEWLKNVSCIKWAALKHAWKKAAINKSTVMESNVGYIFLHFKTVTKKYIINTFGFLIFFIYFFNSIKSTSAHNIVIVAVLRVFEWTVNIYCHCLCMHWFLVFSKVSLLFHCSMHRKLKKPSLE